MRRRTTSCLPCSSPRCRLRLLHGARSERTMTGARHDDDQQVSQNSCKHSHVIANFAAGGKAGRSGLARCSLNSLCCEPAEFGHKPRVGVAVEFSGKPPLTRRPAIPRRRRARCASRRRGAGVRAPALATRLRAPRPAAGRCRAGDGAMETRRWLVRRRLGAHRGC